MPEVFRASEEGSLEHLPADPFASEQELETFIRKNCGLLGENVRVFAEQVDTGRGDRLDLLAVDESSAAAQLLLIELKNVAADNNVLLQALRYASWIMASPDSIRLLLQKQQIGELEIKPTIVIVAPEIRPEVVELSRYITAFRFSFIQVKRFRHGNERLIIVENKYPSGPPPGGTTTWEDWDWDRYEKELKIPKARLEVTKQVVSQFQDFFSEQGWDLIAAFRKWYVAFQLPIGSAWNVCGIEPRVSGCSIWIKLPSTPEKLGISLPNWAKEPKWEEAWRQIRFLVDGDAFDAPSILPVLETAYEHIRQKAGLVEARG